VHDVDAKTGDPSIEPKPEDLFESLSNLRVQPVEIGLLWQEEVVVVLV
jgi:hypothetical protein